ncbi:MAG: anaerobic glycerol-3-phosphate dehydrogenase subunit C [Desulfovibrionaceae bacterium]
MKLRLNPDACIACTSCVVQCPVAEATPEFLGPRMVGPAAQRFRLMGSGEDESLHYCANCKNCDISCPHGVPISTFNMMARAEQARKGPFSLRDWMLSHGAFLARALGLLPAALRNFGMLNPASRWALDRLGVSAQAPLPRFAARTFRRQLRTFAQPDASKSVVFFPGCYVDIYDPQTGLDIVWLLNRAGYRVIVPDAFDCCGLPMIANGFWEDARRNAARNAEELAGWRRKGVEVITACPSCALMFKNDLPEYFPELADSMEGAAPTDAQEFVLRLVDNGELPLPATGAPLDIIYHAPCHLRAQGLGLPGLELLQSLPGVRATNANAGCCGISGSYGFKKEKYHIAQRIGQRLFTAVRQSKAPVAASECGTCRVQIEHGSGKQCLHPLTILRRRMEA